jgi:hypothetical protein
MVASTVGDAGRQPVAKSGERRTEATNGFEQAPQEPRDARRIL